MASLAQFGSFIASRFAPKETPRISRINTGLLEIDSDFVIRKSTSRVMESLLGESPLTGKCFTNIIRARASAADVKKSFVVLNRLIKQNSTVQPVIKNNPFDCLKIKVADSNGRTVIRYIRCEFAKKDAFAHSGRWNVTIRDISKSVRVSRLIQRSNQKAELKINTVMSLLQFEKDLIKEYLHSTVLSLKHIRGHLSGRSLTNADLKKRINIIFGTVHQMKGDAAVLNLTSIADRTHAFESLLSELSMKPALSARDLKGLVLPLTSIVDAVKEVKELFEQIVESDWSNSPDQSGDSMLRRLRYLVQRLEEDSNKRVIIVDDGYTDIAIPERLRRVVNNLVTQLARNAVIHGIEDIKTRLKRNKTPYGCLHIRVNYIKDALVIAMRDDGRGIDPEKIRKVALASGAFNKSQVLRWSKVQLLSAMFKSGLSTAGAVTQHAGRGVGLDVIKSTVEQYGGTIGIKSHRDQFTEFTMTFPRRRQPAAQTIPVLKTPLRG